MVGKGERAELSRREDHKQIKDECPLTAGELLADFEALLDSLTRLGSAVRAKQVNFFTAWAGSHHHAL